MRDLQREQGTSIILITHDMGVVAEMADRVIVMRGGRVVEQGKVGRHLRATARPTIRASCSPPCRASAPARDARTRGRRPTRESRRRSPRCSDLTVRFDIARRLLRQGEPARPRR